MIGQHLFMGTFDGGAPRRSKSMTLSSSSRRESIIHATTPPLCHRCRIETARWVATVGTRQPPLKHTRECTCKKGVIPKGTCVRVIPRFNYSRQPDYLKQNFPASGLTAERCPFCGLRCLMRVIESLFQQICQAAQSAGKSAELVTVVRMN
jgi:hypothetical protein